MNYNSMAKRKLILSILVLVILVVAGYYLVAIRPGSSLSAEHPIYQFAGSIKSIEGGTITLHGVYGNLAASAPASLKEVRELSFRTDEFTQFEKLEIQTPAWGELPPNSSSTQSYKLKDLPRVEGPGSLEDFKAAFALHGQRISVDADFGKNIYGDDDPVATDLFYTIVPRAQ